MGRLRTFALGKLVFTLAFAFSTLTLGIGADAGVHWCESDPLFLVNGAVLDVTTGFPDGYKASLKGPIAIVRHEDEGHRHISLAQLDGLRQVERDDAGAVHPHRALDRVAAPLAASRLHPRGPRNG